MQQKTILSYRIEFVKKGFVDFILKWIKEIPDKESRAKLNLRLLKFMDV